MINRQNDTLLHKAMERPVNGLSAKVKFYQTESSVRPRQILLGKLGETLNEDTHYRKFKPLL